MANVGSFAENLALNFLLNAQTATRPVQWGIGLGQAAPSSVNGSEIGTASGYARQTSMFGAAAQGTLVNTVPCTYGPFSSVATISGVQVWDTATLGAGNMLWYGTLATARAIAIGDSLVIASAALTISLS